MTANDIAAERAAGASDEDLNDTVLGAVALCMVNQYVDGLAAPAAASTS